MPNLKLLRESAVPLFVGAAFVALASGCAANPETLEAPPETRPPAETAAPDPIEPLTTEDDDAPTVDDLTVVIDPGGESPTERQTLLQAAAAERERRRTAPPPTIVITNENLGEHATGDLTVVSRGTPPVAAAGAAQGAGASTSSSSAVAEGGEAYWRQRIFEVRSEWHRTIEEIEHLESRVAEFRRRFYAEDDPYYRDTQIKPSWDRTLERLEEARDAAATFPDRVEQVLEEGRRAGALPGWLREGVELEPKVQAEKEIEALPEHKPQEPTIVEDDGREAP